MRRLPIYILAQTSKSMLGEPIESVNNAIQTLYTALRRDLDVCELAWISMTTYASEATQIITLTEVSNLVPPVLTASSQANLDKALQKIAECANREIVNRTDYHPVLFMFTNGVCFGGIENGLNALRTVKWGYIEIVCVGEQPNVVLLQQITKNISIIENCNVELFFSNKRLSHWFRTRYYDDLDISYDAISGEFFDIHRDEYYRVANDGKIYDIRYGKELPPLPPEVRFEP